MGENEGEARRGVEVQSLCLLVRSEGGVLMKECGGGRD